jgi:hypothetical protein
MSTCIVARPSTLERPDSSPSNDAVAAQHAIVLELSARADAARDALTRASAELDSAIRQRDRAIWRFEHLHSHAADGKE